MHKFPYPLSVTDPVTNTKKATVLITLGVPLQGVFIMQDREHPKSTGGQAHFVFESTVSNAVRRFLQVYDTGSADAELEIFIDKSKGISRELDEFIAKLEPLIRDALIVNGRKFLDNYQVTVKDLKERVAIWRKTGGRPVYDKAGNVVAQEDFKLTQIR
jgi:hypothetical protein